MLSRESFGIYGDAAWKEREKARKRREYTIQAVLILILVGFLAAVSMNVADNLAERHINSGFAFLGNPAGFDIGEALIPFTNTDHMSRAFLVGMLNTIKVSAVSIIAATVLGVVVGLMRLSRHPMLRFLGTAHVEFYRNIPLLVLLLAVYLAVTELLPAGRTALHVGDWVFLSKSGLQYASPLMGGWAMWIGRRCGRRMRLRIGLLRPQTHDGTDGQHDRHCRVRRRLHRRLGALRRRLGMGSSRADALRAQGRQPDLS